MKNEYLYDIHAAADLFGVCAATLRRQIKNGTVKPTRIVGGRREAFFSERDIEDQKLISMSHVAGLIGVSTAVIQKLVRDGAHKPTCTGTAKRTYIWFRYAQLPQMTRIVEDQMSPGGAAQRLVEYVGDPAKALELLQERILEGKFGTWTVLKASSGRNVLCRCDCGLIAEVPETNLKYGRSSGCGSCSARRRTKSKDRRLVPTPVLKSKKQPQKLTTLLNDLVTKAGGREAAIKHLRKAVRLWRETTRRTLLATHEGTGG